MTTVESVRVGDVLRLERIPVQPDPLVEYTAIGVRSFGRGLFRYEPAAGDKLGSLRFFELRSDRLVVSNIKGWEGAVALSSGADDGCIASNRFLIYDAVDDLIDVNWARWYFLSEQGNELIQRASPGSADRNRTLAVKRFEDLVIPLPPAEEQRRGARRLNSARNATALLSARGSISQSFTMPFLESWLGQRFETAEATVNLADVGEVVRGRGPRYEPGSGVIAINQGCVQWDGIALHRAREVEAPWWSEVPDIGRVASGDVLVNSTGEGTIGRAAIAIDAVVGVPFDSHVMAVRTDSTVLLPEYLVLYLRSPQGQDQIIAAKGANTTKQTELGKSKLERFAIPAPLVSHQTAVVRSFRSVAARHQTLRVLEATRQERLAALIPSVLNQEFAALRS